MPTEDNEPPEVVLMRESMRSFNEGQKNITSLLTSLGKDFRAMDDKLFGDQHEKGIIYDHDERIKKNEGFRKASVGVILWASRVVGGVVVLAILGIGVKIAFAFYGPAGP